MAYAITTKYYGPTATRGSSIRAVCDRGGKPVKVSVPYDNALNSAQNHANALQAAVRRLSRLYKEAVEKDEAVSPWGGTWQGASLSNDTMAWVIVSDYSHRVHVI